jgi:hypothetical protein
MKGISKLVKKYEIPALMPKVTIKDIISFLTILDFIKY